MTIEAKRLHRLLKHSELAYWEWDRTREEFWYSEKTASMLGLASQNSISTLDSFLAVFLADDVASIRSSIAELDQSPKSQPEIFVRLREEKSLFSMSLTMCDQDNVLCGIIRNVSQPHMPLPNQERREEILHAILDNTSAVIFAKDLDGKYLLMNEQFQKLFGLEVASLGKDDFEIFPQEAAEKFRAADQMVFEKGHVVELIEHAPQKGGMHTYISTKVPLRDESGQIYAIAGIATDITLEQRAKEELARAAQLKSQFLANMSHEIRTPMNGVLVCSELLNDSELNSSQRDLVSTIRESTEALLSIINGILDFSKIEVDKLELFPEDFSLKDLVARIEKVHELLSSQKGIHFSIQVDNKLAESYYGDQGRLTQILHNLLGNSIKFTPSGERVKLEMILLERENKFDIVQMVVDDTGIGISNDRSKNIFEAFTQADSSITRAYGGTGLGLTISARLVELLQGRIELVEKDGKGARFEVEVPLERSTNSGHAEQASQNGQGVLPSFSRSLSILLVEDNRINQKVAKSALDGFGHTIDCAMNGLEALELLETSNYDVILMDIQMPGMDGIETLKRIRKLKDSRRDTPVLALTAHAMHGDREDLLGSGFNDYLSKPLRRAKLLEAVQRLAES